MKLNICDAEYEPKYFYWEMIVFSRKLLVLVISVWLPPATSMLTRTLALAFIVFASAVSVELNQLNGSSESHHVADTYN